MFGYLYLNTGGTLGLLTGTSFIGLVEICYWLVSVIGHMLYVKVRQMT